LSSLSEDEMQLPQDNKGEMVSENQPSYIIDNCMLDIDLRHSSSHISSQVDLNIFELSDDSDSSSSGRKNNHNKLDMKNNEIHDIESPEKRIRNLRILY
jgi:hypothetical protein